MGLMPDRTCLYTSLFFFLVLGVVFMTILPVQGQNEKMKQEIQLLKKRIERLKAEKDFYRKTIHALKNDPCYLEYVLRKELYYGRKEESRWPR